MSDVLLYAILVCIALAPLIALYVLFCGRKATPDDLPNGDCSHHPDSIRDAQKANGRHPDA